MKDCANSASQALCEQAGILFARMPEASELQQCLQFLADVRDRLKSSESSAVNVEMESWRSLTRALLRANEFVYLE